VHDRRRGCAHDRRRGCAHHGRRRGTHDGRRGNSGHWRRGCAHHRRRRGTHDGRRGNSGHWRRRCAHDRRRGCAHHRRRRGTHDGRRGNTGQWRRGCAHNRRRCRRNSGHRRRRCPDDRRRGWRNARHRLGWATNEGARNRRGRWRPTDDRSTWKRQRRQRMPLAAGQWLAKGLIARARSGSCGDHIVRRRMRDPHCKRVRKRGRERCVNVGHIMRSSGLGNEMAVAVLDCRNMPLVVDDHRVVDIVEDHVLGWRRHVTWYMTPHGDWHEYGNREHEVGGRHERCSESNELELGQRQKVERHRRGRREAEVRIVECKHRALDVDVFFRRRRRHVVVDLGEGRGRRKRDGTQRKAAPSICAVQAMRIAPQI